MAEIEWVYTTTGYCAGEGGRRLSVTYFGDGWCSKVENRYGGVIHCAYGWPSSREAKEDCEKYVEEQPTRIQCTPSEQSDIQHTRGAASPASVQGEPIQTGRVVDGKTGQELNENGHPVACMAYGAVPPTDEINHPSHYTQGRMEVIDAIEGLQLGYHESNVVKYVARWRFKHDTPAKRLSDLNKAKWYLDRLIRQAEGEANGEW